MSKELYIRTQGEDGRWVSKDLLDCNREQRDHFFEAKGKEELARWAAEIAELAAEYRDALKRLEGQLFPEGGPR